MSVPGRPAERYGRRPPWVRFVTIAVICALAAAGLAWVLWAAWFHSRTDVSARTEGYVVTDANTVRITIAIERAAGTPVRCTVQAQAADHAIVGVREIHIPAGDDTSLVRTVVVATERPASSGTLDSCVADLG